jgi:signal transduction histidine kinase
MREVLSVPVRGSTWRRWAHLILGGAMLVPYAIVANAIGQSLHPVVPAGVAIAISILVGGVVMPAVTGLFTAIRELELAAARVLLRAPVAERPAGVPLAWRDRARSATWFVLHLNAGGLISSLTVIVPPVVLASWALPFTAAGEPLDAVLVTLEGGPGSWWVLPAGLAALAAVVYAVAGTGALLARLAPRLLGPSAAERLAALERRAAELAERNRLARELHDSVGHALSIVTIQAAAAERVLDGDPEFARRALHDIGASARDGLRDLDHVLGLLRDDRPPTRPAPALRDLDRLLEATRSAGVEVTAEVIGDVGAVPGALSREAYRIIQEGVTNAARHAGDAPMRVRVAVGSERLEVELTNPLGGGAGGGAEGGGRGLVGVRERVAALRGRVSAGPEGSSWRMRVELPLRPVP